MSGNKIGQALAALWVAKDQKVRDDAREATKPAKDAPATKVTSPAQAALPSARIV